MTELSLGPGLGSASRSDALSIAILHSLRRALDVSLIASLHDPLASELRLVRGALKNPDLHDAARLLDRVWRVFPEHGAITAALLGRMLLLRGDDHYAGLRALTHAAKFCPEPDISALIALAYVELQRFEDARQELETALASHCVEPEGLLAAACNAYLSHPAIGACGWVGRDPKLGMVGEVAQGSGTHSLEIFLDDDTAFTQMLPPTQNMGVRAFNLAPPLRIGKRSTVTCRGQGLLGSGTQIPADFGLVGNIDIERHRGVMGWARIGWLPKKPLRLRVQDEIGNQHDFKTGAVAGVSWQWPYEIDLKQSSLRGHRLVISARLPDGRWHELPQSPLLLEPALRLPGGAPLRLAAWQTQRARRRHPAAGSAPAPIVDVIVPVYGHRQETLECIDSVMASLDAKGRLVVIDDASKDDRLARALDALAADGHITLVRNSQNLGFVGSVNLAMKLPPLHDAILLNSDTLVFGDWLARLRAAAYSAPNVGTVTPFSNNGSIASYPNGHGGPLDSQAAAELHALVSIALSDKRIEIPVGVGFCMYVRRDCFQDVGELDAAAFAKGYGEESDFCLRARARGWSNQLAADVFVYHAAGISFGSRRDALLQRSRRILNLRHPGYDAFVQDFIKQDPLRSTRRVLDERRLANFPGRFVLIVTLALNGGVDRFVTERCRALKARGMFALLLKPATVGDMKTCILQTEALEVPNLAYDIPVDLSHLSELLRRTPLEYIELQHFLHLDSRLIEILRDLNLPYDVFVHDYAWICPRVTLIDGAGRYCGEPAIEVCQRCIERNGSELGEDISVSELRSRSARWLGGARRVMAPSFDTAARLERYFGNVRIQVEAHSPHIEPMHRLAPVSFREHVRVVLMGAIGVHKGFQSLLDCARDARSRKLPIEFVVIGHTENDPLALKIGNVFITGYYDESEAGHLLQREQADVAWLPSVWPETWCYTLDYMLSAGLPVVAFDVGAIAERLRSSGHGKLLPLRAKAARINDALLEHALRNRTGHFKIEESGQSLMSNPLDDASITTERTREMLMNDPGKTPAQDAKEEGLSASVQVLPLPAGLFLFSVKASGASTSGGVGQMALPALHVGLGPGVSPEQVEFLAGPSTQGSWLFTSSDLLVAKISAPGATLVLTSVRAPAGEVLSIKVERLEERAAATMSPSALAASTSDDSATAADDSGASVFDGADDLPLPVQIGAHIRTRGDVKFTNQPWAGRLGSGLWMESFAVRPLERFAAQDIEYKGLTGSGFETPWISDDKMCGTRGMSTPLVGFAIRLKPSSSAAAFDCEYSGYFQSGTTVGPLRNGAPCRSSVANDTLEGIQVRIIKRAVTVLPEATAKSSASAGTEANRNAAKRQPARRT